MQSTKTRGVLFPRSLAHTAAKLFKDCKDSSSLCQESGCKSWDLISSHKFWLSYCPKPLNQAYYTKPSPWGTSHPPSHLQHPTESSHNLLGMVVLKNAVIPVKLLAWYENFLSSVQITEMPQKSIQALKYSVFSFFKKMKSVANHHVLVLGTRSIKESQGLIYVVL